jgi:hypothetical protein
MRLLNVSTLKLKSVANPDESDIKRIRYGIVSHVCLQPNDEEVSYENLAEDRQYQSKEGYRKIEFVCKVAKADRLKYVWLDTCCINGTSESERGEAVRSMYKRYSLAMVCYVYMADVDKACPRLGRGLKRSNRKLFEQWADHSIQSEWFERGWTLQELLAPSPEKVQFFGAGGNHLGGLGDLARLVFYAINIDTELFDQGSLRISMSDFSVAQRFSWAANRKTTRKEDRVYSLMGMFDVHIPVIYSEGEKEAFARLQQEIIRKTADHTIFAWTAHSDELLAPAVECFQNSSGMLSFSSISVPEMVWTGNGFRVNLQLLTIQDSGSPTTYCPSTYSRSYNAREWFRRVTHQHSRV